MITRNYLNRFLVTGIFYLPALGLTGCNGARQLGLVNTLAGSSEVVQGSSLEEKKTNSLHSEGSTDKKAVQNDFPIADTFVNVAGKFGELSMGVVGAIVGGGAGAIGAGIYAACKGASISEGIAGAASKGADLIASCSAPVGKYAFEGTARVLVWGTPYLVGFTKWTASNAYYGAQYAASAIYNGVVDTHQYFTNQSDISSPDEANDKEGIELKDYSIPAQGEKGKCPLGLHISGRFIVLT